MHDRITIEAATFVLEFSTLIGRRTFATICFIFTAKTGNNIPSQALRVGAYNQPYRIFTAVPDVFFAIVCTSHAYVVGCLEIPAGGEYNKSLIHRAGWATV